MSKVREWELLPNVGPHVHRNEDGTRVVYEAGEVIHDSRDLKEMFPDKFGEVGVSKPQTKKKVNKLKDSPHIASQQAVDLEDVDDEEIEETDTDEETDEKDKKPGKSKFGEEVTGSFQQAAKVDLKVFFNKKKRVHTIVHADVPDKPLAEKVKKPRDVEKWLKNYIKNK